MAEAKFPTKELKVDLLYQRKGEAVINYFSRFIIVLADFTSGIPESSRCETTLQYFQKVFFISGLRDDLKEKVLMKTFENILEVKEYAMRIEYIQNPKGKRNP